MDSLRQIPNTSPERFMVHQQNCVVESIPEMLTIEQTKARIPGLSYDYLRKLCLTNKIVHVRAGTKYLINFGRLVEYLNNANGQ